MHELFCKSHVSNFYSLKFKLGYLNLGISKNSWGEIVWNCLNYFSCHNANVIFFVVVVKYSNKHHHSIHLNISSYVKMRYFNSFFFFPSVVGSPNCTPNSSVIFCVSMCYVNPDVFLCYYSFFNGFVIFVSFNNLQLLQHIFCLLSFLVLRERRERITFKQEHFVFHIRWSKDPSDLLCPQPSLVFGASRQ